MIPADHFHDNGDGTALWVPFDDEFGTDVLLDNIRDDNRPCDTCDGGAFDIDPGFNNGICPECHGRKRHTFVVEVLRDDIDKDEYARVRTLRVHVIDVLPIVEECPDQKPPNHICQAYRDEQWIHHRDIGMDSGSLNDWTEKPITLPPAAAPDMWLVRLAVHP